MATKKKTKLRTKLAVKDGIPTVDFDRKALKKMKLKELESTKKPSKKVHKIELVDGVEGPSLYLNDRRIVGPKPWGGGVCLKKWIVSDEDIQWALTE